MPTIRRTLVRLLLPARRFATVEAAPAVLLLGCAGVAVWLANSGLRGAYRGVLHHPLTVGVGRVALTLPAEAWINDLLMAVFFLQVGLEITREVRVGRLSSVSRAALPGAAALGGMVAPALVFLLVTNGTPHPRGWGIPMATDIAFALGVLALVGSRLPPAVRIFLAALAIVDDLGAVAVIALAYSGALQLPALVAVAMLVGALFLLRVAGVRSVLAYLGVGVVLWVAVHRSGLHATVAGVLLALALPAGERHAAPGRTSPADRLERALHLPVAWVIMPLFALANAGVPLGGVAQVVRHPAALGVALGLVLGKPLGIVGASALAVRLRIAALPEGLTMPVLVGVACLGGIGFTMSLFIGALAYGDSEAGAAAKLGILAGSLVSGVAGAWLLRWQRRATAAP